METKPPLPPFTLETAKAKVQAAEDAWNTRDPERVALAYTEDSEWRNRAEFFSGRTAIKEFLSRKWAKELDYRLKKELWCFMENRIAVRFEYEWHKWTYKYFSYFLGPSCKVCLTAASFVFCELPTLPRREVWASDFIDCCLLPMSGWLV
jgi:nuclear transport factor 2 (NTF2) superfamily protein